MQAYSYTEQKINWCQWSSHYQLPNQRQCKRQAKLLRNFALPYASYLMQTLSNTIMRATKLSLVFQILYLTFSTTTIISKFTKHVYIFANSLKICETIPDISEILINETVINSGSSPHGRKLSPLGFKNIFFCWKWKSWG